MRMLQLKQARAAAQRGFTLIELVIVIVIIGILAAVAIPQFSGITDDAKSGVADGVAGAMASAAAINFAACQGPTASCVASVDTCTEALALVQDKPAGTTAASGAAGTCVVTVDGATSAATPVKGMP